MWEGIKNHFWHWFYRCRSSSAVVFLQYSVQLSISFSVALCFPFLFLFSRSHFSCVRRIFFCFFSFFFKFVFYLFSLFHTLSVRRFPQEHQTDGRCVCAACALCHRFRNPHSMLKLSMKYNLGKNTDYDFHNGVLMPTAKRETNPPCMQIKSDKTFSTPSPATRSNWIPNPRLFHALY